MRLNDIKSKGTINEIGGTNSIDFIDIDIRDNGLELIYKFRNKYTDKDNGYKVKVNLIGDLNEIVDNLNHILFYSVYLKKRKFEDIKILQKNYKSNKYER